MSDAEVRKLAAIMFTDMVGYSALSQRDDKLALELLEDIGSCCAKSSRAFTGPRSKQLGIEIGVVSKDSRFVNENRHI